MVENIKEKVTTLKTQIGKRARELRRRAGFSSADSAAEAMGVSNTAVYELERGDNWISPEMIVLMQKHYGLKDAAALFSSEDIVIDPTPEEALAILAEAIKKPTLTAVPAVDILDGFDENERGSVMIVVNEIRKKKALNQMKGRKGTS